MCLCFCNEPNVEQIRVLLLLHLSGIRGAALSVGELQVAYLVALPLQLGHCLQTVTQHLPWKVMRKPQARQPSPER